MRFIYPTLYRLSNSWKRNRKTPKKKRILLGTQNLNTMRFIMQGATIFLLNLRLYIIVALLIHQFNFYTLFKPRQRRLAVGICY